MLLGLLLCVLPVVSLILSLQYHHMDQLKGGLMATDGSICKATSATTCCCLLLGLQSQGRARAVLGSIPEPCAALGGTAGPCHGSVGSARVCRALQEVLTPLTARARGLCCCLQAARCRVGEQG